MNATFRMGHCTTGGCRQFGARTGMMFSGPDCFTMIFVCNPQSEQVICEIRGSPSIINASNYALSAICRSDKT
jgi:hypothetical protein